MAIYNEVFETYRAEQRAIEAAKKLLKDNGSMVYDYELPNVPSNEANR